MIKKIQRTVKVRSLAEVETSIANGHKSFVQLGEDYKAIRDGNYAEAKKAVSNRSLDYKEVMEKVLGYPTLAKYWEGKWKLSINYVNKLIEASEVVRDLGKTKVLPKNEAVAREVAKAPKGKRKEVWKKATKGGKRQATAKQVREQVNELLGKANGNGNKGTPTNVTKFPEAKLDATTFREELNELLKKYLGRISRNNMADVMDSIVKSLREGKKVA